MGVIYYYGITGYCLKAGVHTAELPLGKPLRLYEPRHEKNPDFCICENKDADQLCGNREADQRLCFRYTGSTIPLLP